MKCTIVLSFVLTTVTSFMATKILYVLPDYSTNVSCPSQPCATLSQHLSDNDTLPVLSNVQYHFLPGEHHVPANMTLQNLYNFSIVGTVSETPVLLVGCLQSHVINIINSHFVIIKNVVFKHCGKLPEKEAKLRNLKLSCCYSCKVENVTFLQYGLSGSNLIGKSYLNYIKIKIMPLPGFCCQGVLLQYSTCSSWNNYSNHMHYLTIENFVIHDYITNASKSDDKAVIYTRLKYSLYHLTILLKNSHFYKIDQYALLVDSRCYPIVMQVFVINCTFEYFNNKPVTHIILSPFNQNNIIRFVNCQFNSSQVNTDEGLIAISVKPVSKKKVCKMVFGVLRMNKIFHMMAINASFIKCQFSHNTNRLLLIQNLVTTFDELNVLLESLSIFKNKIVSTIDHHIISITKANVRINGPITVVQNLAKTKNIMQFRLCDLLFSGEIKFDRNICNHVISLNTHIKIMEHTDISFIHNEYQDYLIAVETTEEYYEPYPFCLFQYIPINGNSITEELLTHYVITFSYNSQYNNFKDLRLHSESDTCSRSVSVSFCHFIYHCKWLPSATFHDYSPEYINNQIIQYYEDNCNHYKYICYGSCNNCSVDMLGPVYPGQTLQAKFCSMYSNDVDTVLYAEVHNINLPNSTCKIAHQSQLINVIGNGSNAVNYTIVSSTPDLDRCELILTATPLLNKLYDAFHVQLLSCPVGFTLQDGVCDCDPDFPSTISICNIGDSTIRRPANIWITVHDQTNDTKYLISHCPMDYCLPYSSNVNLLHPHLQCQFNRTGILCSQCQHPLSMVFASSRCMECTDLHILITIIVIVAGIVLVFLLYLLNLTVTNGTINGIIFYANIISINDSVFLINNNVLKPLRVFISFTNLDLGIETCFYNGMDGYAKSWLQLFFPFYLITLAATIIIASHYSSRILRLTYTRSLPVLATLFLLSYNSVLRAVLTVLFSYSTITHLPSDHKQIVWSIDASVPLFGLKFTILFITCLVLFLLLIPFNIILLFTRHLLQFKIINRFKPLLDAFQGSYKDKYYYWVAAHITLRSVFFALYGFQTKFRLTIATVILILFTAYHGYMCPHKNKLVNIQELLLLINLTIMHAVSYQGNESVFSFVTSVMISLVFIQFCTIVMYHLLTYTLHCNVMIMLQTIKQKISIIKYFTKRNESLNLFDVGLLDIPERTHNYTEYQDGLVSDDFN